MARRSYSDEDKAVALAALEANGGNKQRTAKDLCIPKSTLTEWANGSGAKNAETELRHQKKADLANELEAIAHQLAGAMGDKIANANLQQTATSLGITIDKMQLLRGKPTGIVENVGLTDDERAARVAALLDAARARRDGRTPGNGNAEPD